MERGERFMQEKINLAIIGGGASGLVAAGTSFKNMQTNKTDYNFRGHFAGEEKSCLLQVMEDVYLTNIHASAKHCFMAIPD